MKFDFDWLSSFREKIFEIVDDDNRIKPTTNDAGALVYYKLTL